MWLEDPFFMKNEAWYYFDWDEFKYKLTDQAPPEAQQSYREFYERMYKGLDEGIIYDY